MSDTNTITNTNDIISIIQSINHNFECCICFSTILKNDKKYFKCYQCNNTCCFNCYNTHLNLLNDNDIQLINCLFCKNQLSITNIIMHVDHKTFTNKLKFVYKNQYIFEKEKYKFSEYIFKKSIYDQFLKYSNIILKKESNFVEIKNKDALMYRFYKMILLSENYSTLSQEDYNIVENIKNDLFNVVEEYNSHLNYYDKMVKLFNNMVKTTNYCRKSKKLYDYNRNKYFTVYRLQIKTNEKIIKMKINSLKPILFKNDKNGNEPDNIKQYCYKEDCVGIVIDNYCNICNCILCTICDTIYKNNTIHVCKEEDIASLNNIKQNSVNCPKCNILISRISGCLQMFCTRCYTKFNYSSKKIYTSNMSFHNIHYTQYLNGGINLQNNNNSFTLNIDNNTFIVNLNLTLNIKILDKKFQKINFPNNLNNSEMVNDYINDCINKLKNIKNIKFLINAYTILNTILNELHEMQQLQNIIINEYRKNNKKLFFKAYYDFLNNEITKDEFSECLYKILLINNNMNFCINIIYKFYNNIILMIYTYVVKFINTNDKSNIDDILYNTFYNDFYNDVKKYMKHIAYIQYNNQFNKKYYIGLFENIKFIIEEKNQSQIYKDPKHYHEYFENIKNNNNNIYIMSRNKKYKF